MALVPQKDFVMPLVGLMLLASTLGCFSRGDDPNAKVSGQVTMEGSPLADVLVAFEPIEPGGRGAWGITDAGGQYTLRFDSQRMGINSGEYTVSITNAGASDAAEVHKSTIPNRYNTETTLTQNVTEGNNTIDFNLEAK